MGKDPTESTSKATVVPASRPTSIRCPTVSLGVVDLTLLVVVAQLNWRDSLVGVV